MKKFKSIRHWDTADYGKNALVSIMFSIITSMSTSAGYNFPIIILGIGNVLGLLGLILGIVWIYRKIKKI